MEKERVGSAGKATPSDLKHGRLGQTVDLELIEENMEAIKVYEREAEGDCCSPMF
jgi:hypothetical protein